ncbi:unnamed protein product [Caenorhabditis auriculariae]|uniref:Ectonucleotide pyrophosphatase/phosphodiesterase family member 6 n=1 Tax=Caenorhabditis auriculariae TaxID=2777116 RepID=A0A8S1GQE7_9PELO|nr:unnamed protein product [Caenorhabditis auriculariae]
MLIKVVLFGLLIAQSLGKEPAGQNLIVILVDGFGAHLFNNTPVEATKALREIGEKGVQADYVTPVFPTHTWPQWMSLATGLYTENHGFTADYMWDRKSNLTFERGTGPNDTDEKWWLDAKAPFWYTAAKAGVDLSCFWFAHCHLPYYDVIALVEEQYRADLDIPEQTDSIRSIFPKIVNRITKYQSYKQQMFLLRYAKIGEAQKNNPVNSAEITNAIKDFDAVVADLTKTLEEKDLFTSTNVVILSDHGYAPLAKEEQFFLEQCLPDFSLVKKVVNAHSVVMVFTEPEDEGTVHYEFSVCELWSPMGDYDENDAPFVKTYKMSELPEELHWKNSRFMSGVVLITKPGTSVVTKELPTVPNAGDPSIDARQTSGWEPSHEEMRGIFFARGSAFRVNERFGPIEIVDVYQMLLNILSIEPAHPHNGSWSNVEGMLTEDWEKRGPENGIFFEISYILIFSILFFLILQ